MSRKLGRAYELEEPIGRGAMGEVWRGRNTETSEAIAAKLLRPEYTADQEVLQRFVQERSILLSVRHPNLVQVRDLVVEGNDLAIVMDLVEGGDLRAYATEHGRLPPAEAVELVTQVLEALAVIHAARVFHRDVKPENVLLDRSTTPPSPKLSDFGIARLAEGTSVRMSQLIGTPDYLAPEVISSEIVTPAADVYACGVMLYELLAGRTPFGGQGTPAAIILRQVSAAPPPLSGAPDDLASVLELLLVKDPSVRPDATAAAAMLRAMQPSLVGAPALPEQAPVADWQARPGPDTDDPEGGTILKGQKITGPDPLEDAPIWTPAADGASGLDERGTRMFEREQVSREPAPVKPAAEPEQVAPPPNNKRNTLIAAGAVAAIVLIVGFVVLGRGGESSGTNGGGARGPAEASAVEDAAEHTYGLLSVARTYELIPEDDGTWTLDGTVDYEAGGLVAPDGPVLEVVPRNLLEETEASVVWAENRGKQAGSDGGASWTLPLDGRPEATFSFTLSGIDLGEMDPSEALAIALTDVDTYLREQLEVVVYSPADENKLFLALDGLEVEIDPGVEVGARTIDFSVAGRLGSGNEPIDLFVSKDDVPSPTSFLTDSLGGADLLSVKAAQACNSRADGAVVPIQEGECTIEARLGSLAPALGSVTVAPAS